MKSAIFCQSLSSFSCLKRSILHSNIPPMFWLLYPFLHLLSLSPPIPPPVVMYFTVAGGLVCIYLAYNQYSCPYHSCLSLDVSLMVGPSNVLSYTICFFFFNWSSSLWKNLTFSFDLINAHSFSPAASTTVSFAHFSLLNFSCF